MKHLIKLSKLQSLILGLTLALLLVVPQNVNSAEVKPNTTKQALTCQSGAMIIDEYTIPGLICKVVVFKSFWCENGEQKSNISRTLVCP